MSGIARDCTSGSPRYARSTASRLAATTRPRTTAARTTKNDTPQRFRRAPASIQARSSVSISTRRPCRKRWNSSANFAFIHCMDPFSTKSDGSTRRVLIVDADAACRAAFGEALRTAGYEVVEAWGAAQAMRLVLSCRPDAVVLELVLPDG